MSYHIYRVTSSYHIRSPDSNGQLYFWLLRSKASILTDQICRANDLQWLAI